MMAARYSRALHRRRAVRILMSLSLAACSGGGTDADQPATGTVTVILPATVGVTTGHIANAAVTITRQGRTDPMTLSVESLPSGVTVVFNPPVLTGSTLSSTATLTATTDATVGSTTMLIRATGADGYYGVQGTNLFVSHPQITIAKSGTGTGTVTSNPTGINCGGACSATFANGTSVTLTAAPAAGSAFAGWAGGECSGSSTTCTYAISNSATVTATFNSTAQSFSFATNSATASAPQGGNATATATITRVNGYAGAVTFTATGAPSGLTITAPSNVTGNSATLNIAAASTVPAGSYPITISATGAGITGAQTTTLNVQVTPAAGGNGNVSFSFASCDPSEVPIWFASQSGSGAWTRVTPGSNSTFTLAVATATGVAWVTQAGTAFTTNVIYASGNEITSIALGSQCTGVNPATGTKTLTGTVVGAPLFPSYAEISIGGASTQNHAEQGQTFTLNNVPSGRRDLLATTQIPNSAGFVNISRMIFRRNVSYASTIPQLSLFSAEAFVPPFVPMTRINLGTDQPSIEASFITANGASETYYRSPGGPNFSSYYGIPDTLLQPGDLHAVTNVAAPPSGSSFRLAITLHHAAVQDTVTFGPTVSQPTITTLGASPYLRMRAQLVSQSAYNAAAVVDFSQNSNVVSVTMTAGYSGTLPATWTLDIPDFGTAGYDPTWGLKSGSPAWQVTAAGGDVLPFLGAAPFDGARLTAAGTGSLTSAQGQRAHFRRWY